jgi:nickel/cobalt transporter (NicO) family protein
MRRRLLAPLALLSVLPASQTPASAHRLDEYLQATRVSIDVDRVGLEIDLTPGVSVAPQVLAWIDVDRNGEISPDEGEAYARQVIGSIGLFVDGRPESVTLVDTRYSDVRDLSLGVGTIRLRATAKLSTAVVGPHQVSYLNSHRPDGSVYLVNALVPSDPRIRIADQQRDRAQRGLTVNYSVRPWTRGWLLAGLAMVGALITTRRSRAGASGFYS